LLALANNVTSHFPFVKGSTVEQQTYRYLMAGGICFRQEKADKLATSTICYECGCSWSPSRRHNVGRMRWFAISHGACPRTEPWL